MLEQLGVRLNPQNADRMFSKDSIFWDIGLCDRGSANFPVA